MSILSHEYVIISLLCLLLQGHSFILGGRGLCTGFLKMSSIARPALNNEATVNSMDILKKHLMEKTACLAVLPKMAFSDDRIKLMRSRFANENTWNSFLTKDQLTSLVIGKYFCPVIQYATARNWCIFIEKKRADEQYKRLTRFITEDYYLEPESVNDVGHPVADPNAQRHKFMFCKKFHMIVLDGIPAASVPAVKDEKESNGDSEENNQDSNEDEQVEVGEGEGREEEEMNEEERGEEEDNTGYDNDEENGSDENQFEDE